MTVDYVFLILPTACWWIEHHSLTLKQQAQDSPCLYFEISNQAGTGLPPWSWAKPPVKSWNDLWPICRDLFDWEDAAENLEALLSFLAQQGQAVRLCLSFLPALLERCSRFLSNWEMGGTYHLQGSPQLPQWCCMRSWILCPEAWEVELLHYLIPWCSLH